MWLRLLTPSIVLVSALVGLVAGFMTFMNYQIYSGAVIADARWLRPDGTMGMKAIVVSLPELLLEAGVTLLCVSICGAAFFRWLRDRLDTQKGELP